MSCDDNHEARANDRVRRSLPVVGSGGSPAGASSSSGSPAPRKLWRSLEERSRAVTPGAANEFPGGAAELSLIHI